MVDPDSDRSTGPHRVLPRSGVVENPNSRHFTPAASNIEAPPAPAVDAYAPAEIAARVRDLGVKKANLDLASMLALAILAGAFIALGFEHSIANMYFFSIALLLKTQAEVVAAGHWSPETLQALSIAGALRNLIPVTLGNLVGGAGLVGGMYWFIYLRQGPSGREGIG